MDMRTPLGPEQASDEETGHPSRSGTPETEALLSAFDRRYQAGLAALTGGISPIALFEAWQDWALHLMASPGRMGAIGLHAVEDIASFQREAASYLLGNQQPAIEPANETDRRFADPAWQQWPYILFREGFKRSEDFWREATRPVPGLRRENQRLVEFYARQWLDMASPSNFLATNPEVIARSWAEKGENLVRGFNLFLADLQAETGAAPDASAESFRPGEDVAVTPGVVVYRNALFELIQYRATTQTVRPEPILVVPAWIMKYYILDLSPQNSLVRHLVESGFTVFAISWRNPDESLRDVSLDDYRKRGVMEAIAAINALVPGQKIHATGYCLGGTLLAITAAAMAREKDERLASLSLFAAQVDFSEPGELGLFITDSQLAFLEGLMAEKGYLDQHRMAGAFQMLHSRDLVWSKMVRDYLMGERAPMTDLMAWNADATRMPLRMHVEYLTRLFRDNELARGLLKVENRPVYLEDIALPVFSVATETDHVAPWHSVFKMIHLLDTDVTFLLTNGGHNGGIVSEPGHPHRHFRTLYHPGHAPNPEADPWFKQAVSEDGSWWPKWVEWLNTLSGADIALPDLGNVAAGYPILGPAPGHYVLER